MSLALRTETDRRPYPTGAPRARILLVDDEPAITEALGALLRREGYEVHCADSADVALDILATDRMDVVVSDERMPGESGSALLAEVRQRYPATLRIMLTGHATVESAVRAINEGEVYRFLLKPCHPEDLKLAIRQGLQHRRLVEQNRWLLQEYRRQADALQDIDVTARVMKLKVDEDGAIVLNAPEGDDDDTDVDELISEIERELFRSRD